MSRKSRRLQASCSSQRNSTLTQQTLEETFGGLSVDVDDQVNKLVRYIVNRAGSQSTFKQSELKKNVFKTGSRPQEIMERAAQILKNV